MPREDTEPRGAQHPTGTGDGAARDSSRRRVRRLTVTVAVVVLGMLLVGMGIDILSMSPSLCTSCHEMRLRAQEWEVSAHGTVACLECHQTPRPWYAVPRRLVDRAALLVGDVSAHLSGEYADPVDSRSSRAAAIEDDVCLQCHDPNRKATSGYRILIDHVEHAKRNGSCVSCHVRTAHPIETRGRALTFMAQCFTCHGTSAEPEARAECGVCHPSDYALVPATHSDRRWARSHGETALSDLALCTLCHEESFCTQCHGIEMPHPDGWEEGTSGHGGAANADRSVCRQCHGSQLEMCAMCHHRGYDPLEGTWVKQHPGSVLERGASWCMECHMPMFCVDCHLGATAQPE